jgi:hypothetical protein
MCHGEYFGAATIEIFLRGWMDKSYDASFVSDDEAGADCEYKVWAWEAIFS